MNNIYKYIALSLCLLPCTVSAQEVDHKDAEAQVPVAFGEVSREDVMGGVSDVSVSDLMKKDYHADALGDLQSLIGGYNGNVWGQAPLILVDGVPRDLAAINATEVEHVTVLKAASAVVLYGSRGSKGVILITTKRGKKQPLTVEARANTGLYFAKRYPHYLGAAEYMSLYNEACDNDGKAHLYTDDQIYQTSLGSNPYRYPDMNLYSGKYLRKCYNRTDATVEITGGNDNARYYANLGFEYNNGFIKYGKKSDDDDLNFHVRTNINMKITSWLHGFADVNVNINNAHSGRGDFWGAANNLRPNWYSGLLPVSMMDMNNEDIANLVSTSNHLIDGQYMLGGTSTDQTTLYGDMLAAGYVRDKNRYFMFDVGLKADLGMLLPGLTFETAFALDYKNYFSEAWKVDYATYEPKWSTMNGKDMIVGLTQYGKDGNSTSEYVGSSTYNQTILFRAQLDYKHSFGLNNIDATLMGWGYQQQLSNDENHKSSSYHRTTNYNYGIRAGYNYDHKYYAEFAGALVHSAKFASGKRDVFSPSLTLGWRLGQEQWFKNALSFVDDAKINASYSVLNQDLDISDYYMYKGYYDNHGGWYQWKDATQGGFCNTSTRGSNPDLGYIQRKEFRIGFQTSLFDRFVTLDFNYFNQLTDGLLTQGASTVYPSYYSGNGSFLPYLNYNQDKRSGFDYALNINKKIGKVEASLGFTGQLLATSAEKRDEVYSDDYLYRKGHALDAQWGYVCEGFFKDQTDIDNHARQTFGEVKPGDLKYKDLNGDNVIDSKDQVDLGKAGWSAAPYIYGLNLTLKYRNFTLFLAGAGSIGAKGFKNSAYYWVKGSSKYSEIVRGRWTEATANTATYPRLTTTDNSNNFRNSTFWRFSTDRFDLNKVQLTYDMPSEWFQNKVVSGISVYLLGESLFTISGHNDYFETNLGAPYSRFYNLGVKLTF